MARLGRRQPNRPIVSSPSRSTKYAPPAGGNPTVREYLDNSTDGPSFNLITGSSTAVDDVLVVFHAADAGAASAMTTPTGTAGTWTQVELADLGTGNTHLKLWTRAVTAGGAQTVTIPSNTGDNGAMLYVIAGADPASPVDGSANTTGTASTSHIAASVSPASTAALLLATVASEVLSNSSYSAVSGGMTNLTEEDVSALGIFFNLGTARQNLSASGATGTRTFTYGTSKAFAAITVAIKPAAGGGGTNWTQNPTDSAGLTDGVILDQSYVKTDSAGLTDTTAFNQSYVKTDSAGLTDSAAVELVKLVASTDDAGLTDTFALEQDKVATDSVGLTDVAVFSQSEVVTDSAGLTDSSTIVLGKVITATDDAGLTDSIALQRGLVPTDSAGLTDTTALTQSKTATDSAGLTDTATQQLVKDITQTDSAGLTDSQTYSRTAVLSDSTGLTDTLGLAQTHIYTDSAGLTDDATPALIASFEPAFVSVDASTGSSGPEATTSTGTLDGTATLTGVLG